MNSTDTDHDTVRQRIHARREEMGMSQLMLAKAVGVSQATIQKIESGEITGSKFLPKIWRRLELPLAELDPLYAQSDSNHAQALPNKNNLADNNFDEQKRFIRWAQLMSRFRAVNIMTDVIAKMDGSESGMLLTLFRPDGTDVQVLIPEQFLEQLERDLPKIRAVLRTLRK